MGISLRQDPSARQQEGRALQYTGFVLGLHSCLSPDDFELLSLFLPTNIPEESPPLKDTVFPWDHFLSTPVPCGMFLDAFCSFYLSDSSFFLLALASLFMTSIAQKCYSLIFNYGLIIHNMLSRPDIFVWLSSSSVSLCTAVRISGQILSSC